MKINELKGNFFEVGKLNKMSTMFAFSLLSLQKKAELNWASVAHQMRDQKREVDQCKLHVNTLERMVDKKAKRKELHF